MESRNKNKEMEEKLMNLDINICLETDEFMMNLCKENLPCAANAEHKAPETVPTTSNHVTISKYDFCQTKEAVKASIEIPGICNDMKDKLSLTATELSFCFELKEFKKKNWKLEVLHLAHEIIPSEVHFLSENDKGTLVLPKKIPIEWASLTPTDDTLRNEWNLIFKDSYIELIPGATRESFDSICSDVLENVWSSAYSSACIGNSSILSPLDQMQQKFQFPKDYILELIEDMITKTKKIITAEPWVISNNLEMLGELLLEKLIRRNGGVYTEVNGSNAQPRDSNYYYNLALKYYLEYDFLNAMNTVNNTLQLDRCHFDGKKLKLKLLEIFEITKEGNKEQKNLNFEKAISLYKKVMDIDPSHERLKLINLNSIAECFLMQMNYVSAIEYLTKVLEYAKVDREIVLFYLKRAKCYKLLKHWQEAVNDYELAYQILPYDIHKVLLEEAKLRLTAHNNRKDYYAVLGLDSKASMNLIWKSYKKLKKEHQSNELSTDDDKLTRKEKFKEIREAYSILFDPVKREKYDKNEEPIAPVADGEETIRQRIILNSILPSNQKISWVWSDII